MRGMPVLSLRRDTRWTRAVGLVCPNRLSVLCDPHEMCESSSGTVLVLQFIQLAVVTILLQEFLMAAVF